MGTDQLNQSIQARAFTTGQDIFFRQGQYDPGSKGGQELLAHELTHVVQQTGEERLSKQQDPQREQNEVDRRLQGNHGSQKDGSGQHGSQEPTWTDRANREFWYRVTDAAEVTGLTNSARHMRHYLDNTGEKLRINADLMVRDVPSFNQQVTTEIEVAKNDANNKIASDYAGSKINFNLTGTKKNGYATQGESQDWFFAVGGFTYWYTAAVTVTQPVASGGSQEKTSPPPQVEMKIVIHVYDRYNWDKGKAVMIAGIVVSDEQLGRLHQVGIAREYDVEGETTSRKLNWTYTPPTNSQETTSGGGARRGRGGRVDPTRRRR